MPLTHQQYAPQTGTRRAGSRDVIMKTRRPAAQRQRTPTCAPAPLAIHSTAGATQPVPPSSLTILPLLRQSYGLRTGTRWAGPGSGMLVTRPTPVRGPRATAKPAAPPGIHTDAANTPVLALIREDSTVESKMGSEGNSK